MHRRVVGQPAGDPEPGAGLRCPVAVFGGRVERVLEEAAAPPPGRSPRRPRPRSGAGGQTSSIVRAGPPGPARPASAGSARRTGASPAVKSAVSAKIATSSPPRGCRPTTRRVRERPAVADPVDLVADLLVRVTRPQEVGVQRVHPAPAPAAVRAGRHERLPGDLPAEDPLQRACSASARRRGRARAPRGRGPPAGPPPGCRSTAASRVACRPRARGSGWSSPTVFGRAAGDDDDPVAVLEPADGQQREVDLARPCRRCARPAAPGRSPRPRTAPAGCAPAASMVKASSGRRGCSAASRRTVSPVWVNAASALTSRASPTSLAARTIAPDRSGTGDDAASSGTRTSSVSTASMIRSIVRTAAIGYFADRGLPRQHHRVGAVEHRVGDVGGLGAGRPGVVDHRLEHLGGHDDRLVALPGGLHGALLHQRAPAPAAAPRRGRRGRP